MVSSTIRGFTSFADRSTDREAVAYLNEFFGVVVPILEAHGGRADELLGDGVLGVFGAPERCLDHAARATAAGPNYRGPFGQKNFMPDNPSPANPDLAAETRCDAGEGPGLPSQARRRVM